MKSDVTMGICWDYKVTVKKYGDVEQHPLPTMEDLFATLADGVKFSKVDIGHAYQHVLIDDHSKKYLTLNTH